MNFLAKLSAAAEAAGLQFLLIGGNAVMSFGSNRTTEDVDLMIDDQHVQNWSDFLETHG
jgi:predicted nucleotidyltransferase